MPSPIEILLDPVSLAVIAIYLGLMVWEARFPARALPYVKHWKLKGLAAFAVYFYLASYLPLITDPYLEPHRLFDLTGLGTLGGAAVGILIFEFGLYAWHRAMHSSGLLWRTFHQMHHSAERLDTYGAFFFSPMDMIGFTLLGSVCFALLAGITPQAITITLLLTNFLAIFQHANIKTPHWLGYIFQRPESHAVHHGKGIHRNNYSDLPVFDILFGTFYNPKVYENETGFYHGASARIGDMLRFKDISREAPAEKSQAKGSKVLPTWLMFLLAFSGLGMPGEVQAQDETAPFREATATVDGFDIHYQIGGSGPAMLMLHGLTLTGSQWMPMAEEFRENHTVIVADLPGHGGSSPFPDTFSFHRSASLMLGLLDELGVEKVHGIGHSGGSITLLHMAVQQPQRLASLTLVAGPHFLGLEARKVAREDTFERLPPDVQEYYRKIHPGGQKQVDHIYGQYNKLETSYENISAKALSALPVPTLLVWGDRDPFFPLYIPMEMYDSLPQATLWVIPGQGHVPLWPELGGDAEAARRFVEIIREFTVDRNFVKAG